MKELIIRSKKGDSKALEEILKNFTPLINNTAISFYIYGYDNEDIKQIARLAIINSVYKFNLDLSDSFPSYVKETVRNSIYKEIEKAEKVYFKDKISREIAAKIDIKEIVDGNINIQEEYLKKESKEELEKAIALLNEEERSLLKEIYLKGKSVKEYSEENNLEYHKSRYAKDKIINKLKDTLLNA